MTKKAIEAPGLVLQEEPFYIYVAVIPGEWLLEHTTPSWRLHDAKKGFQRIVKESRARSIAASVLEQRRTFPNAIILATDVESFRLVGSKLSLPAGAKLLVVDGQHRLWAQNFSKYEAHYPCIIHMDRSERDMGAMFLEINDTQRRVPSSLRWDLVRLVKPEGDEFTMKAADMVYELTTRKESPFFQRIDRTGEQPELQIKQGSIAPEIKAVLRKDSRRENADFEDYYDVFESYFAAIRDLDRDGWGKLDSTFYKARILRALISGLSDLLSESTKIERLTAEYFSKRLGKIDTATLTPERVKAAQGAVGVTQLYNEMKQQVLQVTR